MADLEFTVDMSEVAQAEKRLNSFQTQITRMFKKFESGAVTQKALNKGLLDLKRSYAELGVSSQKASGQVDKFVRSLKQQKEAQDKAAQMDEFFRNQRRKLALMAESEKMEKRAAAEAKRAADERVRAATRQANAEESLRRKYIPLYAASKDYEQAIREINRAYTEGVLTQGQYLASMENIDRQMSAFGSRAKGNVRSMNAMGMATQQVGYQVGDFLVQWQSGTNVLVAFGQQATQLVGILPMMAESLNINANKLALVSTVLGIVIPLVTAFGAAFMRVKEGTDKTSDSIDDLNSRLQSLDQTVQNWLRTKKAAEAGITVEELIGEEGLSDARKNLEDARANLAELQALVDKGLASGMTGAVVEDLFKRLLGTDAESNVESAIAAVEDAEERVRQLEAKAAEEQTKNFLSEFKQYDQKIALLKDVIKYGEDSAQVEATRHSQNMSNLRAEMDLRVAQGELTRGQADDLILMAQGVFEAEKRLSEAEKEAKRLGEAVGFVANLDLPFTVKVQALAEKLGIAADEAKRLLNNLPVGVTYGDPNALSNLSPSQLVFGGIEGDKPAARGGGGGGGAAQESAIERLRKQLDLEQQLIGMSEARRRVVQALGGDYAETSPQIIQDLIEQIEVIEELKNKQAEIQGIADTIQSSMSDAFMSMVDGTKSASDAFKDMARAIIKQLYDVLVVQRLVGSFDSKTNTGVGLVGMLMGGLSGARAAGGTMMPGGNYLVGEEGPEIIKMGTRSTIFNNDLSSKAMSGGGQMVDVRVFVDDNGNFDAKVDRISRQNISRAAPAIVQQSVGEVVNKVKRGGSTKDAFR